MRVAASTGAMHWLLSAIGGAVVGAVVLTFASCATAHGTALAAASTAGTGLNPVYLTNKKRVTVLSPSAVERPVDVMQRITADFRGRAFSSDCLLVADEDQLFMAILNEFGTTMGELSYDGENTVFESSLFPPQLKAEYVVFDVQLCYYRADVLREALSAAGLRFVVGTSDGDSSNTETRSVYDGKKEIIHIEKTADKIVYKNLLRGYSYTLAGAY